MKKIFLLSFLVLSICLPLFSQEEDKKSESLTVAFMDKYGKLLEENRYEVGKVSGIKFDVVILKNILDGKKIGSLRITTKSTPMLYYGYLDYDEIDNCIQALVYFKDKVLPTKLDEGSNFKEVLYRTRDYVELGVRIETWPNEDWAPYILTHSYNDDSKEKFRPKDIEKIISIFNNAKDLIAEKLK